MSWVDSLRAAAYRAAFDAKAIGNGFALELTARSMDEFADVYGARDGEVGVAIIMRVQAIPLSFGDQTWRRYSIGADYEVNDPLTNEPALRNPFYQPAPGSSPKDAAGTLEALHRRGAIFLVCDVALRHAASRFATKTGRPIDVVHAELRAALVPGATLVPSGIFGLIRAQNAGCALVAV